MYHTPIISVLPSINLMRGGVTRNGLRRAMLLAERLDTNIEILTFDHNPDYDLACKDLRDAGLFGDRLILRNIFTDLMSPSSGALDTWFEHPVEEDGLHVVTDQIDPGLHTLYDNGVPVKVKLYENGRLKCVDTFGDAGIMVTSDRYDIRGRLRESNLIDAATGRPHLTRYLDPSGHCFMTIWRDPATSTGAQTILFDRQGELRATYDSELDLRRWWLDQQVARHDRCILLTEWRTTDAVVSAIKRPGVTKIKTLHTNHLEEPRCYGAGLRARAVDELSRISEFDAFVVLSQQQCEDIARQFGPRTTFHTVPNAAQVVPTPDVERDPHLVVGIGRYHRFKRWDRAIRAFALVHDRIPDARMEIWGFGPESSRLKRMVRDMGLTESVSIAGLASEPTKVLASAAISVLSSPAEAFPLVPMESMAVGTPMVAFDVNYGVRDQITHGVDGVLVTPGDTKALAEAMIDLLTNVQKRERMGEAATRIVERLGEPAWIDSWLGVLAAAEQNAANRRSLDICSCRAIAFERDEHGIRVSVEVLLEQPVEDLTCRLYLKRREPFTDEYVDARCEIRDSATVVVSCDIPLSLVDTGLGTWDLSVSLSARNAHRFGRVAAPTPAPAPFAFGRTGIKPYATRHGNLSFHVTRIDGAAKRAVTKLRRLPRRIMRRLSR